MTPSPHRIDWRDALLLAGILAILTAVYLLAGFPWTLLAAGILAIFTAARLEAQSPTNTNKETDHG
jgi:hypothetical protein